MMKLLFYLFTTNWLKTLVINFHYFPLRTAIKLPILVSTRVVLKEMRGSVVIDGQATTGMMLLGYPYLGTLDYHFERTIWQVKGNIVLKGNRIGIGRGTRFCVNGECFLGDHFTITGRSTIICNEKIYFGANNLISWDVLIMDTDYHKIYNKDHMWMNEDRAIEFGDDVWIGCRSTVLKGSYIPTGSIVASCSTITRKLNRNNCIYSDKTIIKEQVYWER